MNSKSFIKCEDVVSSLVDEASERFSPLMKPNEVFKKKLMSFCAAIDSILPDLDAEGFDAEVDEDTTEISVSIICPDLVVRSIAESICLLFERSIRVGFSYDESDAIRICLTFPGIWERAGM